MESYNYRIKRENGSYYSFDFYVMLLNLNKSIINDIIEDLSIFKIDTKSRKEGFIDIYISELSENTNLELIIIVIKRYNLSENDYGWYIDITSDYDHNFLNCPVGISNIYQKIGGILYIT